VRKKLNRLLVDEEGLTEALKSTRHAQRLALARRRLLEHIRQTGSSGDLSLVIDTERIIVEGDLERYANSNQMVGSLNNALNDLAIVEKHDARKSAISAAQKLYVQRQAQTLGRTITQTTL